MTYEWISSTLKNVDICQINQLLSSICLAVFDKQVLYLQDQDQSH